VVTGRASSSSGEKLILNWSGHRGGRGGRRGELSNYPSTEGQGSTERNASAKAQEDVPGERQKGAGTRGVEEQSSLVKRHTLEEGGDRQRGRRARRERCHRVVGGNAQCKDQLSVATGERMGEGEVGAAVGWEDTDTRETQGRRRRGCVSPQSWVPSGSDKKAI